MRKYLYNLICILSVLVGIVLWCILYSQYGIWNFRREVEEYLDQHYSMPLTIMRTGWDWKLSKFYASVYAEKESIYFTVDYSGNQLLDDFAIKYWRQQIDQELSQKAKEYFGQDVQCHYNVNGRLMFDGRRSQVPTYEEFIQNYDTQTGIRYIEILLTIPLPYQTEMDDSIVQLLTWMQSKYEFGTVQIRFKIGDTTDVYVEFTREQVDEIVSGFPLSNYAEQFDYRSGKDLLENRGVKLRMWRDLPTATAR